MREVDRSHHLLKLLKFEFNYRISQLHLIYNFLNIFPVTQCLLFLKKNVKYSITFTPLKLVFNVFKGAIFVTFNKRSNRVYFFHTNFILIFSIEMAKCIRSKYSINWRPSLDNTTIYKVGSFCFSDVIIQFCITCICIVLCYYRCSNTRSGTYCQTPGMFSTLYHLNVCVVFK